MNVDKIFHYSGLTDLISSFLNPTEQYRYRTLTKSFHKSVTKNKSLFNFICKGCEIFQPDVYSIWLSARANNSVAIFEQSLDDIMYHHLQFMCVFCQTRCHRCNEIKSKFELINNTGELVCKDGCETVCHKCGLKTDNPYLIPFEDPDGSVAPKALEGFSHHTDFQIYLQYKGRMIYNDLYPTCEMCYYEQLIEPPTPEFNFPEPGTNFSEPGTNFPEPGTNFPEHDEAEFIEELYLR